MNVVPTTGYSDLFPTPFQYSPPLQLSTLPSTSQSYIAPLEAPLVISSPGDLEAYLQEHTREGRGTHPKRSVDDRSKLTAE